MQPLVFIQTHHAQIAYTVGFLIMVANVGIKLVLRIHPLAEWLIIAEKRPRLAALARLLDSLGISPISVVQSLIDFIRNESSPGTVAATKALGVSASKPLIFDRRKLAPRSCHIGRGDLLILEGLRAKLARGDALTADEAASVARVLEGVTQCIRKGES